ncbi:hypothetical protein I4U23_015124 [Adineta vaga]|nr:hypothetical protein I4U23_015124 [Adineta vaga]
MGKALSTVIKYTLESPSMSVGNATKSSLMTIIPTIESSSTLITTVQINMAITCTTASQTLPQSKISTNRQTQMITDTTERSYILSTMSTPQQRSCSAILQ